MNTGAYDPAAYNFHVPFQAGDQVVATQEWKQTQTDLGNGSTRVENEIVNFDEPVHGVVTAIYVIQDGVRTGDQQVSDRYIPAIGVRTDDHRHFLAVKSSTVTITPAAAPVAESISGNPILDAFAARRATEAVSDWVAAVESTLFHDLHHTPISIPEASELDLRHAYWALTAMWMVINDQRDNDDTAVGFNDAELLHFVNDTLRLPGTRHVPGGTEVTLDGTPLASAYATILTMDSRLFGVIA